MALSGYPCPFSCGDQDASGLIYICRCSLEEEDQPGQYWAFWGLCWLEHKCREHIDSLGALQRRCRAGVGWGREMGAGRKG